ncbi:hypothetical protein B0H21DRAFT_658035, partial [Amylocystis lapponica]
MARILLDPNTLECPDYASEAYAAIRQPFIAGAMTDEQAVALLVNSWTFGNNADKAAWQAQLDEDVAAAEERVHLAAEAEAQRKEAAQLDAEQVQKEDMKKNRGKYVAIPLRPPPKREHVLPAGYATRKMDKGLYVELHYYTDRGLDEARATVGIADSEAMAMRQNEDGTTSWIPAGSARDAKTIVEDKDLRWEQLLEAIPRAIVAM